MSEKKWLLLHDLLIHLLATYLKSNKLLLYFFPYIHQNDFYYSSHCYNFFSLSIKCNKSSPKSHEDNDLNNKSPSPCIFHKLNRSWNKIDKPCDRKVKGTALLDIIMTSFSFTNKNIYSYWDNGLIFSLIKLFFEILL